MSNFSKQHQTPDVSKHSFSFWYCPVFSALVWIPGRTTTFSQVIHGEKRRKICFVPRENGMMEGCYGLW
jgi:hypothetical protein